MEPFLFRTKKFTMQAPGEFVLFLLVKVAWLLSLWK